jgi:hypothetical protein
MASVFARLQIKHATDPMIYQNFQALVILP